MVMNFADAAKKKLADVERPPLPPEGHYRWRVSKLPESTTSKDELWDFLTIPCQVVEALEDVDLADYKGDVKNITNRVQYIFDKSDDVKFEQTLFNVRRFFENALKCCTEKDSIGQAMNNSIGYEFIAPIKWVQDKNDKELFHANVGKPAPVE